MADSEAPLAIDPVVETVRPHRQSTATERLDPSRVNDFVLSELPRTPSLAREPGPVNRDEPATETVSPSNDWPLTENGPPTAPALLVDMVESTEAGPATDTESPRRDACAIEKVLCPAMAPVTERGPPNDDGPSDVDNADPTYTEPLMDVNDLTTNPPRTETVVPAFTAPPAERVSPRRT